LKFRYFNSNMVRLKENLAFGIPTSDMLFQFQYGAIKGLTQDIVDFFLKEISIPIWCD